MHAESIRVTGIVQGVGFRPTVWRIARECRLVGSVRNDADGVLIHAWGRESSIADLARRLLDEPPPLARIEGVRRAPLESSDAAPAAFTIVSSASGAVTTDVAADASTCLACREDIEDISNRRYRYPFTNCTHCGPRLSIIEAIPYDRANTSMATFDMCPECRAEYTAPADRRFHAQPNACPACGPSAWLEDNSGRRVTLSDGRDALAEAAAKIVDGQILAIKGIGGFHLACDATNATAVALLRQRKRRYQKAFAMMAKDLTTVARFARVGSAQRTLLLHRAAPIVVLDADGDRLPDGIAPGQSTLGFMLPYTPLHELLLQNIREPIVLTSGNVSDEPQVIDNSIAREQLSEIADYFLMHDRDIVNRLDDSVVRVVDGAPRFLRRARGYAPEPLCLHESFADGPTITAMGGELKNTFCLFRGNKAVVSQHIGDMEDMGAVEDQQRNLELYASLYEHKAEQIAVDMHPDYLPTKIGHSIAARERCALIEVQHHHAHIASCLAENGYPLDGKPVLGIALDGLGYGDDGTLWGGEFLAADFRGYRRLARFSPQPLPGGARAMREPWRNTWAHLRTDWRSISRRYADLEIVQLIDAQPLATLERMVARGINSPLTSSCGRLFDAIAAALGLCMERAQHEGQAASELEALAAPRFRAEKDNAYPVDIAGEVLPELHWSRMWCALLDDLLSGESRSAIAARFHHALIAGVSRMTHRLAEREQISTVVLSGGVFQNRLISEGLREPLSAAGLTLLIPALLPANDGGLSLGQAAVARARAVTP